MSSGTGTSSSSLGFIAVRGFWLQSDGEKGTADVADIDDPLRDRRPAPELGGPGEREQRRGPGVGGGGRASLYHPHRVENRAAPPPEDPPGGGEWAADPVAQDLLPHTHALCPRVG